MRGEGSPGFGGGTFVAVSFSNSSIVAVLPARLLVEIAKKSGEGVVAQLGGEACERPWRPCPQRSSDTDLSTRPSRPASAMGVSCSNISAPTAKSSSALLSAGNSARFFRVHGFRVAGKPVSDPHVGCGGRQNLVSPPLAGREL